MHNSVNAVKAGSLQIPKISVGASIGTFHDSIVSVRIDYLRQIDASNKKLEII